MRVEFSVPGLQCSSNQAYVCWRNRIHVNARGKAWKATVAEAARSAYKGIPTSEPVSVEITVYFRSRASDIDGILKLLLDGQQSVIYKNDRQITDLVVHKRIDSRNPRTEVVVSWNDKKKSAPLKTKGKPKAASTPRSFREK